MAKEEKTPAEVTISGYLIGLKPDRSERAQRKHLEMTRLHSLRGGTWFRWMNGTFMTGALVIFAIEPKPHGVC